MTADIIATAVPPPALSTNVQAATSARRAANSRDHAETARTPTKRNRTFVTTAPPGSTALTPRRSPCPAHPVITAMKKPATIGLRVQLVRFFSFSISLAIKVVFYFLTAQLFGW